MQDEVLHMLICQDIFVTRTPSSVLKLKWYHALEEVEGRFHPKGDIMIRKHCSKREGESREMTPDEPYHHPYIHMVLDMFIDYPFLVGSRV